MKRTIASIAIGSFLLAAPLAASAQTTDMQAQIAALLQQVQALQQQLVALIQQLKNNQTPPTPTPPPAADPSRWCGFARQLSRGANGSDVSDLQAFLQNSGFFSGNMTGYFGSSTAEALARWQSSEGIAPAGILGPVSRQRIFDRWCGSALHASPMKGVAPLTVSFWHVAGSSTPDGYSIDFGDGSTTTPTIGCGVDPVSASAACPRALVAQHTYSSGGTYKATLSQSFSPCGSNPQCMASTYLRVVGTVTINVSSGSQCRPINYMPIACSDGSQSQPVKDTNGCITGYTCPDADFTVPANCKAWNDGCNECVRTSPDAPAACTMRTCIWKGKGYCSTYFDNTSSSDPVISSFSGPISLNVNETGTWTVEARDPQNQQLTYSIIWGDEQGAASGSSAAYAVLPQFVQTTTFTHSYSAPGIYVVTIVVKDTDGHTAHSEKKVIVGQYGANKPPVISSFSGPTILTVGQTGTWTISASDPEGAALHYRITWGDEAYALPMSTASTALDSSFTQDTTFTHSYSQAGTYTVGIVIGDGAGGYASASATVKVSSQDNPVACTADYAPVCGLPAYCYNLPPNAGQCSVQTNAQTFSNICMLNAAGATFLYNRACSSTSIIGCPQYNIPGCLSTQHVVAGSPDANGCPGAPRCVSN